MNTDPAAPAPYVLDGVHPLLETKLYIPRARSTLVSRSRLIDRLNAGAAGRLTILSAPAGYGKSTLLGQWLAESSRAGPPPAWVSLDTSDNDPKLFWAYVVAALQRVHPSIGSRDRPLPQIQGAGRHDAVLGVLLNTLAAAEDDTLLILDDYHTIESREVHDGMTFFIDHLPHSVHVVIATRSDPPLPLARLRARGQLTELRAVDLRFSREEASAFLRGVMSLDMSDSEVLRLADRAEGWITALKLAAMGGGGAGSASGVPAFRGEDGFVADYVIEEVLRAEPEPLRRFLLATSILERLSGDLCDEVAQQAHSGPLLVDLARRNLFVAALDNEGTWYRFHHLFAEALQNHARRSEPELLRAAHHRASQWYERHGGQLDAVHHALEAGDEERAAVLLESEWPERNQSYRSVRWLAQARELPRRAFENRPLLTMGYAWALLNQGEPDAAETPLQQVEGWLSAAAATTGSTEGEGGQDARHGSLEVELAAARSYQSQMRGDAAATLEHARRAIELVPESDYAARATGTALIALALWGSGRLDEAFQTFDAALTYMRRAGRSHDAVRGVFVLGDLRSAQGRLHEAAAIYESGLRQAVASGVPARGERTVTQSVEADELYLGLAEIHHARCELTEAEDVLARLAQVRAVAAHTGKPQRLLAITALLRHARGDSVGALSLLAEAARVESSSPLPQSRPLSALTARVQLALGRFQEAQAWSGPLRTQTGTLTYLSEFEHLTLARVLLAESRLGLRTSALAEATTLLDRLVEAADEGGRKGSLCEALALLALARQATGDRRGALTAIARSLELADAEGYVRVFVDEGTPMRDLLRHALARGLYAAHVQKVLSAMESAPGMPASTAPAGGAPSHLTAREISILRLVGAGLRNQEIAGHLFISTATVKRHIANIYLKLGVSHRTAALARAAELKLL